MPAEHPGDRPPTSAGDPPPWPPIRALAPSGPPPDRRPPLRPRQIVVAAVLALGVGALLGSAALVGLAERQPFGTQRDIALGAAEITDRVAHGLSLNRPAESLADALDGEEEVYDVEALIARARAAARPDRPPVTEAPAAEPAPVPETAPPAPDDEPAMAPDDELGLPPSGPAPSAEEPAGSAAEAPSDQAERDPPAGPPPDGLITPIEGVDCVLEDPNTPPTTAGSDGTDFSAPEGSPADAPSPTEDPTACPPGFVPAGPATDGTAPADAETNGASLQAALFEAPRTPDADEPLLLYVGGDSISRDLGEGLARLTPADLVKIDLDPRPATGLSRPDFFDWSQHLAGTLTVNRPDVIVVLFGANDFQNVEHEGEVLDRFGNEWLDLYRKRVERIMTLLSQPGTQTVWVGQPPVREPRLSGGLERLNTVYAEAAARHPQVSYVDAWRLFSDPDDGYVDEIDGVRLRREDGVHLTVEGGNRLAEAVWDLIAPAWGLE
ncbi:MAG: DUF459 domain-containing protein [Acidimicrobiia bacterium]|nr:DUF459 domain-containing protein [Acidimicrobiia bacterium]